MRQYELTYLVSDNVSESDITKVTGKIGGYVSDEGGKVLKEESWGRRKLAYPINKQLFATYITTSFELEPDKLRSLEREIKHENDVIRHLLIVKEFGKEALTLTAEDIAATEEIEKVVGGEKSFEAVLGETEESKDLMAVRGEDTEAEDTNIKKQDTSKSQESKSEDKEIEEPAEIIEKPVKIVEAPMPESGSRPESVGKKLEPEEKIEIKKPVKKQAVKKTVKKAEPKVDKVAVAEPKAEKIEQAKTVEPSEASKPIKKKAVKEDETVSDEADRLAKLNQELDDILGEDL